MIYHANKKTWMRSDIFIEWLNHFDYYFHTIDWKILLLIDNAVSYFNPKRLEQDDNDENEIDDDDDLDSDQESSQRSNQRNNKKKSKKK